MKFLIVLAIIALVAPNYGQEVEEKTIVKRSPGNLLGLGGIGYGGHLGGYSSYSAPAIRVSAGLSAGHGGLGLSGGYGRLAGGHGGLGY